MYATFFWGIFVRTSALRALVSFTNWGGRMEPNCTYEKADWNAQENWWWFCCGLSCPAVGSLGLSRHSCLRRAQQRIYWSNWENCNCAFVRVVSGAQGNTESITNIYVKRVIGWLVQWFIYNKSLARPGKKQATTTKPGIYSTYSPWSSIHILVRCSNFCKPLKKKKNSERCPSNHVFADDWWATGKRSRRRIHVSCSRKSKSLCRYVATYWIKKHNVCPLILFR
jgi:hypothetical protein